MTCDPQDFEASLLPTEDLIMSMSPGDYVVIGGLKMEMQEARDYPPMNGMVYLFVSVDGEDVRSYSEWYGFVHVRGSRGPGTRGACWDKQHLAKSIAAGEFWIG
jgi:hypothetical protein